MPVHLIRRLEQFTRLSSQERQALHDLDGRRQKVEPRADIIAEGDKPEHVNLVLDGWACRYKQLEDGRRQIISVFLPGDLCDDHVFILSEMDHSIGALTPVSFIEIPRDALTGLADEYPRLRHALWWDALVTAAIQREWTVNLGQRTAYERMAHLFCELFLRLRSVGLAEDDGFRLPITQVDLAELLGLTPVHVNRTLKEMRKSELISLERKRLTIPDPDALMEAALFNPNYLHLGREGRHLDAN